MRPGPAPDPSQPHLVVQTPDVLFSFTPEWGGVAPPPFRALAHSVLLRRWRRSPRVCVLGYGLGGLAKLLLEQRADAQIVGVDPDPWMTDGARPWLTPGVRLVQAGAEEFLRRTRRTFDLVLDDCFELHAGVPVRPPSCLALAVPVARCLAPDGVYVRNVLPDANGQYADQIADMRGAFAHVHVQWFQAWENRLVIASRRALPRVRGGGRAAARAARDGGRS